MTIPNRILVIRLGALGDLVMCCQSFHEIRMAHPAARIALLVAPAFAGFARLMPWFDEIIIDDHPSKFDVAGWLTLIRRIRAFAPSRVYDLQGKLRQSIVYALLGSRMCGPEWSGAAPLCTYPRFWPPAQGMSFRGFLAAQLRRAGVAAQPPADMSWLSAPLEGIALPERFALLIPGCSPGHDYKRWPVARYAALARHLVARGITPMLVGTKLEAEILSQIAAECPEAMNLTGKTSLPQLGNLARNARVVVGNDTGPMHMAAAMGAPTLALLSPRTNPVWSAPPGAAWVQHDPLESLPLDKVLLALSGVLDKSG